MFAHLTERIRRVSSAHAGESQLLFNDVCQAVEKSLEYQLSEDVVNEAAQLIVHVSKLEGLPINDALQLWKVYLLFLKQHQSAISAPSAEMLVSTISGCVSEGLDASFLGHVERITDCTALSRKLQLLLFFCQRLITTIVHLSASLCDDAIMQGYEQLLMCRGVCFALGIRFKDQTSISSKMAKFDTLFENSLELQPSQQHRRAELDRRIRLYHCASRRVCACSCTRVQHRYVVLGILSYSGSVLRRPVGAKEEGGVHCEQHADSDGEGSDRTAALLLRLLEIVRAAAILTVCFCGEVVDEVNCTCLIILRDIEGRRNMLLSVDSRWCEQW
mmetsp:Transcript_26510/g.44813  ORF Transcript_26510/g.44813 Transcript_26510/m.44813 type:complete len:331 (+) Transcript_26510:63-1055(+)